MLVRNAAGQTKPVPVEKGGIAGDIALVVLVNKGTASASEIVSGALQDAGRAKLVGETTFGTGTVLERFPLSDGSALTLAIEEWLTPDGHTIWHKGITPNLVVALPEGVFPVFPEEEIGMTAQDVQDIKDTQLRAAMNVLSQAKS